MKTEFKDPILSLVQFAAKDVFTASVVPQPDDDELPFRPSP